MPCLLIVKTVDSPIPDGPARYYAQDCISVLEQAPKNTFSAEMQAAFDFVYIEDLTVEEGRQQYLGAQGTFVPNPVPPGEPEAADTFNQTAQRKHYVNIETVQPGYRFPGVVRSLRPVVVDATGRNQVRIEKNAN